MDQFSNKIAYLARTSGLSMTQRVDLDRSLRDIWELNRLRRPAPKAPRPVKKKRAPEVPQQVTRECKICHLPWPHLTKWARSRHGLRLLARKGTKTRKRILAGGQPWGEKFREMGRARMAQKYTEVRVAIFKKEAPRAFLLLGQRAVEELINERKHRLARDRRSLFRDFARHRYGGVPHKRPWVNIELARPGHREWVKSLARTRPSGVHVK